MARRKHLAGRKDKAEDPAAAHIAGNFVNHDPGLRVDGGHERWSNTRRLQSEALLWLRVSI
jgi:hypothetical protein